MDVKHITDATVSSRDHRGQTFDDKTDEENCSMIEEKEVRERDKKLLSDIDEYGCHLIHVLAEDDLPPFCYSVGIWQSSGAPELIIVGLKQEISSILINDYNRCIRNGESFQDGQVSGEFLEGFDCLFLEMDKSNYAEYLGSNLWLYRGDNFPTLQLIYPNKNGVWPWQPEASDAFKKWQPLLWEPPSL
jgi:Domain of unknown function (DUF4262)